MKGKLNQKRAKIKRYEKWNLQSIDNDISVKRGNKSEEGKKANPKRTRFIIRSE